jgi:hypothetical protein
MMVEVARVSVQEARDRVSGGKALLVCAYDNDDKFAKFHLEGAISFSELKGKVDSLTKDQELIFYCA